jgi:hypothetical protein
MDGMASTISTTTGLGGMVQRALDMDMECRNYLVLWDINSKLGKVN